MPLLSIIVKRFGCRFEFLVGLFRFLVLRLSGRLQRVVNGLRYAFTIVKRLEYVYGLRVLPLQLVIRAESLFLRLDESLADRD
jgi:hypothetical protein